MADRPRYSHAQLEEYFERIGLPEHLRLYTILPLSDNDQLAFVTALTKHHLVKVPFENLTQHYSWHKVVDVSPAHLFKKIVQHAQGSCRGGYCMENNSLYHTVLLSLGLKVYMAGARVYDAVEGKYGGFSHCVNIVVIGDRKYMLDVGFGPNGPTGPVPLELPHVVRTHVAPANMRVMYEPIPQQVDQDRWIWIYQHRFNEDAEWVPMYCFVDLEFLLEDIRGMNLSPWRSPTSFFTRKVLATRFTTDLEVNGERGPRTPSEEAVAAGNIDGALVLFEDTLKWRRKGETKLDLKFENEAQRVAALERYFGIALDEEDREAIRGTVSEIK
ncbi:cysteine proteinase [Xylariomycetidae sp. FL2044]|nr:cysteine proteinase [Xylariomycetidae sp. FL2044]